MNRTIVIVALAAALLVLPLFTNPYWTDVCVSIGLYALLAGSYRLQPLPVDGCDPGRQRLTVIGNLLDWTIAVNDDRGSTYYAVDAQDYHLLKKWECPAAPPTPAERIGRWLMPLRLTFTSPLDKWIKLKIEN